MTAPRPPELPEGQDGPAHVPLLLLVLIVLLRQVLNGDEVGRDRIKAVLRVCIRTRERMRRDGQ